MFSTKGWGLHHTLGALVVEIKPRIFRLTLGTGHPEEGSCRLRSLSRCAHRDAIARPQSYAREHTDHRQTAEHKFIPSDLHEGHVMVPIKHHLFPENIPFPRLPTQRSMHYRTKHSFSEPETTGRSGGRMTTGATGDPEHLRDTRNHFTAHDKRFSTHGCTGARRLQVVSPLSLATRDSDQAEFRTMRPGSSHGGGVQSPRPVGSCKWSSPCICRVFPRNSTLDAERDRTTETDNQS